MSRKYRVFPVRMSEEERQKLAEIAFYEGESQNGALRRLIGREFDRIERARIRRRK